MSLSIKRMRNHRSASVSSAAADKTTSDNMKVVSVLVIFALVASTLAIGYHGDVLGLTVGAGYDGYGYPGAGYLGYSGGYLNGPGYHGHGVGLGLGLGLGRGLGRGLGLGVGVAGLPVVGPVGIGLYK